MVLSYSIDHLLVANVNCVSADIARVLDELRGWAMGYNARDNVGIEWLVTMVY